MNKNIKIMAAIAAVVVFGAFVLQKSMEPRTYEDCILAHVERAENKQASILVMQACRAKFPLPPPKYLTDDEVFGLKK